jgi:hypothetical protein
MKEALSAQRQELEDQIRAVLASGNPTGDAAMGGSQSEVCPEISVENLPEDVPSVGSIGHDLGECRRCNFFPNGHCLNGRACAFCHYSHEKRKLSRRERRERRQERQKEDQENPGSSSNAFSEVSSNMTTPTITPTCAGSSSQSLLPGYYNQVFSPPTTPMVTPTASIQYAGFALHPPPARIMCNSEAQTDDDLPDCIHCGAIYSESVQDEALVPESIAEAGTSSGDGNLPGNGPPENDGPPENEEQDDPANDENDEDTLPARRIAELGG